MVKKLILSFCLLFPLIGFCQRSDTIFATPFSLRIGSADSNYITNIGQSFHTITARLEDQVPGICPANPDVRVTLIGSNNNLDWFPITFISKWNLNSRLQTRQGTGAFKYLKANWTDNTGNLCKITVWYAGNITGSPVNSVSGGIENYWTSLLGLSTFLVPSSYPDLTMAVYSVLFDNNDTIPYTVNLWCNIAGGYYQTHQLTIRANSTFNLTAGGSAVIACIGGQLYGNISPTPTNLTTSITFRMEAK